MHPVPGEHYMVTDVYTHHDNIYGPQVVVVLEKASQNQESRVQPAVTNHNHLYDILVNWLKT